MKAKNKATSQNTTTPTIHSHPTGLIQGETTRKVEGIQHNAELVGILQRIESYAHSSEVRELQKETFLALMESLRNGETGGTIKLPTGTGKTRVFAMLLRAFEKNGLILVPRVDLYDSTARDLYAVGFDEGNIHFLHEQEGGNTEDRMMALLTNPEIDWQSRNNQCIMTYQALTSMIRKNPEMGTFMRSHFDITIEDEAHRGLGSKTKAATEQLTYQDIEKDEAEELQYEQEAESIVAGIKYNYKLTATPDLLGKSVAENGEYIYYATVEDAVRTGAIILPQYVDMGEAYTKNADLDTWKISDIEKLSEGDNFVDESGKSIRDKIIDAYIEKKQEHGTLPGVAFASTVEHARQIIEVFEKKGIRAERVTSARGDISSRDAIERMERGELDVIVTVTKVSEGFDYPPLACAMWFSPSLSPAKIFQGNGRIMRITDEKKPESIEDENGKIIPSGASYIIAPSAWYGGSSRTRGEEDNDDEELDEESPLDENNEEQDTPQERKRKLPRIGNFYELLIDGKEIDINSLGGNLIDIVDSTMSICCEVGEEKEIDGVMYVGVIEKSEVMGVRGKRILKNLRKTEGVKSFQGRKEKGYSITLVPVEFVRELINTYEAGEEKEIDGVVYVGVNTKNEVIGVRGQTILRNLKKAEGVKSFQGRCGKGYNITLVPVEFVKGLQRDYEYECEAGEEKEIDGVMYVGVVTSEYEVMGVRGVTILDNLKRTDGVRWLRGGNGKGRNITLVPVEFVRGLQRDYECEAGEEKEIDGVVYVGVTRGNEVMGVKGQTIINNLKKTEGVRWIRGGTGKGRNITLVPVEFIKGLKVEYECEVGEEKEIDGVVYVGVSESSEVMGVKGQTIINNLKKAEGVKSFQGRTKKGHNITLIPVEFINSLKKK